MKNKVKKPSPAAPGKKIPQSGISTRALIFDRRLLEIANQHTQRAPLLEALVREIKNFTGCEAVGIRMLDNDGNIPYHAYVGFCEEFYERESPLSVKSDKCMCINVVQGNTDPEKEFYTKAGSFYSNATTRLLATFSDETKGQTRNVCNEFGYESVALVPIRLAKKLFGLIHIADRQRNKVPLELVNVLEEAAEELGIVLLRINYEQNLSQSELKYRGIFDESVAAVFVFDEKKHFIDSNQAGLDLLGYSRKQLLKMSIPDVDADPIVVLPSHKQFLSGKNLVNCEHRLRRKNGKIITVLNNSRSLTDTEGNVIGMQSTLINITERKQVEERLRVSEGKYRTLVETMNEGLSVIDTEGVIIYANPRYCEILRRTTQEVFGHKVLEYVAPEEQQAFIGRMAVRARGDIDLYELTLIRKDKQRVSTLVSPKPLFDKDGKYEGCSAIITNITERKKAEEELRKTQRSTQRFNEKLRILHEVTNELTKAKSTDEVCRLAVELGRKKLGFPRIGIWLKKADPEYIRGTFGTDKNGNICDERGLGYKVRNLKKAPWKNVFYDDEEMSIEHDCELHDARRKIVGKGTRAATRIWDGKDSIGIIFVDDLLEPGAITDRQIMIIKSFASTVGHLYSQKRAEEETLEKQEQLRDLTAQLSLSEEHERRRIAEGLHDDIIQPLIFLDVKLKTFLDSETNSELIESYQRMRTIIGKLINDVRDFTTVPL